MKLFTVGPVEMYEKTLEVAGLQLPYFRTDEFSTVMLDIEQKLKDFTHSGVDSKAIVLTGSGSCAMEAVVNDALSSDERVLIINGGSFGQRFVKLCQIHNIPYDELKLSSNEVLTKEHFDVQHASRYGALLVNIHETSTGQLYNMKMISTFTKKHHISLIVDAISSFLADPYDMDAYGIDCTIISSQKALALAPGIAMIVMKDEFYQKRIEHKPITNLYLSIKEHVDNMKRGQTPNTPAVGIILELQARLHEIAIKGSDEEILRIKNRAEYFRSQLEKHPKIQVPNYPLSNALTPICFPDGGAQKRYQYLKDKYAIYVTPSGGELADHLLRIGHLGNLKNEDYDNLLSKLEEEM